MNKRVFHRVESINKLLTETANILDVGCGDGSFGFGMFEKNNSYNITNIDCDYDKKGRIDDLKTVLRVRKDEFEGKISFIEADFRTYKFKQKFDLVTSFAAIDYIQSREEQTNLIQYLKSITNQNGYHFISMHVGTGGNMSFGALNNPEDILSFYNDWTIIGEVHVRNDPSTGKMVSIIAQKP